MIKPHTTKSGGMPPATRSCPSRRALPTAPISRLRRRRQALASVSPNNRLASVLSKCLGSATMIWKLPGFGRISAVNLKPPAPAADRHGLAVVVAVKNEERHVEEWARFHAAAGVRAFFAYDDGSTDASVLILRQTLGAALTVVPWTQRLQDGPREIHNQVLAYAHAVANFGQDFRWMTFIDVDEFLIPKVAQTCRMRCSIWRNVGMSRCPGICSATAATRPRPSGGCSAAISSARQI